MVAYDADLDSRVKQLCLDDDDCMILCVIRLGTPLWRGMARLSQLTRGLASSLSFAPSTGRLRSSLGEIQEMIYAGDE